MSTYVGIFDYWWEIGKFFSQMFWNVDITLYVTKQCAWLSCSTTGPAAMNACMGMFLSSVRLLTHRVSTIHIPTFWQQCNFSPGYTVSAFHPVPSFCSTLNVFFIYGRSCRLTRTVMIKTTHCFKYCVAMCTQSIGIETVNLFLSSCCVKAFNSAVRSPSFKIRLDDIFETSKFVLTRLESLRNLHQTRILCTVLEA